MHGDSNEQGTSVFIAAQFMAAKMWQHLRCPPMDEGDEYDVVSQL